MFIYGSNMLQLKIDLAVSNIYLKVKIDGTDTDTTKGRFVKGPYKPMCWDCAIYFLSTVHPQHIFVMLV